MLVARARMIPSEATSSGDAAAIREGSGVRRSRSAYGVAILSPKASAKRPASVVAARTVTSTVRVLEALPAVLRGDSRVAVVFAYDPGSGALAQSLRFSVPLGDTSRSGVEQMAFDDVEDLLWLTTGTELRAYDPTSGALVRTITGVPGRALAIGPRPFKTVPVVTPRPKPR